MTSLQEMKLVKRLEMQNLIGRIRPFPQKAKKNPWRIRQIDRKTIKFFSERNSTNENDVLTSPKGG